MTLAAEQLPMFGSAPAEPVPPVASRVSRAECSEIHHIERRAVLVCNLTAGHEGPWHWDEGDQVAWRPARHRREVPCEEGSRP